MKKEFIILIAILISYTLLGQSGTVSRYKKIDNTNGNLGNVLGYNYRFGGGLENIGDIDNDGVTDFAAGIHGYGNYGGVYILFMDTNGTVKNKILLTQNSNGISGLDVGGNFGRSVACIGDINNDGVNDIAVGEPNRNEGSSNTNDGAIHIICLNSSGVAISQQKINSTSGLNTGGLPIGTGTYFGNDIAKIGDLNNDGIEDIVVGSFYDSQSGSHYGAVWVLLLNQFKKVSSYYKIRPGISNFNPSMNTNDYFGSSVGGIGDFNGDNIPDIAVGAFYDDDGISDAGAVYILHLTTSGSVSSYLKYSNQSFPSSNPISGNFGCGVDRIPDVLAMDMMI